MKNFGLLLVTWLGTNMLLFCGLHCGVPSSLFLTTISVLVLWPKTLTQLKIDSFILHCLMLQRRSFNMRVGLVSTLVSTPSTCVLSSTPGLPSSSPIKSPPNGREVLVLRNGRFEKIILSKQNIILHRINKFLLFQAICVRHAYFLGATFLLPANQTFSYFFFFFSLAIWALTPPGA